MVSRRALEAPGSKLAGRAAQRKAEAERRSALIAGIAAGTATRADRAGCSSSAAPSRLQRSAERYLAAVDRIRLYQIDDPGPARLSPLYRTLVEAAVDVMNDGEPQALMSWPGSQNSPSALAALLTLGALGSAPRYCFNAHGNEYEAYASADPVRCVIYPYARTTHAAPRGVQVDAGQLGRMNFDHYLRTLDGSIDQGASDYHKVLARVRNMDGRAIDGEVYAEFQHPVLDEIVPSSPPKGMRPATSFLLWRTKNKTDVLKLTRTGLADNPASAQFFTYNIRAADRIEVQLRSIRGTPNLIILDLTRAGRARLGWDWVSKARAAVQCMRNVHPGTGILAITDDPWTYDTARFDLLCPISSRWRRRRPAKSRAVFAFGPEIVVPEQPRSDTRFEGARRLNVDGFHGAIDHVIANLRTLHRDLTNAGDLEAMEATRAIIGKVRRAASLPGSLSALSAFLERETSPAVASDILTDYRIGREIEVLTAPTSAANQMEGAARLPKRASTLLRDLERATPMASLLADALGRSLRASSRSVFVFRDEMIAEFAADQLAPDFPKFVGRYEAGMISFGGKRALDPVSVLPASARNQWKRVVMVAPTRAAILTTLARPWVPDEFTVLADADTLAFAGKDARRLLTQLGDTAIAGRLNAFATAAEERVAEIGRHGVLIDVEAMPPEELEFRAGSFIDLSGGAGRGSPRLIELRLESEQRLLARHGTGLVLRNPRAPTTAFVEKTAGEVREGDEVCVIGPAFIERARSVINVRTAAAAEIRAYHGQVAERFARLGGTSINERLRSLITAMGSPEVSIDKARYWVTLDQEMEKSIHEVTPHAPQDRETFMRFTAALGIGPTVASSFWLWAVVAQRSYRIRAGNAFHDAFKGILVDAHSALAENSARAADVRALRSMAERYTSAVAEVRHLEPS